MARRGAKGRASVAAAGMVDKAREGSAVPAGWREPLAAAGLCLATVIAYWPALNGSLVWDDDGHLTKAAMQSVHGLWRIWFDLGATQQYYPLLHSLFWVQHRLWGDAFLGYHLTSVGLHAISALLVVAIVRRLELKGAWLAGFLFALHPVCVESVAWIAEEKNTLAAFFALAAVLAYLRFDRTREMSRYILASALFVLALLSKTVVAPVSAAILVALWWKRGRLEWRRDVLPMVPWLAIGAAAGLFTAWVEKTYIGAQGVDFALTPVERVLIAGRAMWFYAWKMVWPASLIFTYPHWNIHVGEWRLYLAPAGVVGVAIGLLLLARRERGPLAAFLIFTAMLFPALGFLNVYPFRYSFVADHFQYLASLGILIPAAFLLTMLQERATESKRAAAGAFPVLLLIVLGVLSWRQAATYADAETLYRDVLAKNPDSWMTHNGLGNVLFQQGRIPDSIAEYDAALRLRPNIPEPHGSRGVALLRSDPPRTMEAIGEFDAALRINPKWAEARVNLGNALLHVPGAVPDSIAQYETALLLKPDLAEAHNGLGNALAQTPGRLADAVAQYEAALRTNPDYLEAHVNLGTALAQIPGRERAAIAQYQIVLQMRPDLDQVREALGHLLAADSSARP